MERKPLFGGQSKWRAEDWTASDDRVRGGKSQSYLSVSEQENLARFHGNLDIKTLGGAGFASQRTTDEDREWDLSEYDGIELVLAGGDSKRYTLTLKDELLPKNPDNGREQSTISYEYDFQFAKQHDSGVTTVQVPWSSLKATYRGKEKPDAPALKTGQIVRFSLMMRSFFGTQEGDFSLIIQSVSAVRLSDAARPLHQSLAGKPVFAAAASAGDKERSKTVHQPADTPSRTTWVAVRPMLIVMLGLAAVSAALYTSGFLPNWVGRLGASGQ